MSFWKRLFGGGSNPTPAAPVTPQPRSPAPTPTASSPPASTGSLELPPEFDGKMSYRDMFRTRTPEQLHAMCRALPVEQLNLSRPGISREMGRAITQVFAVAIYMATKEVPAEFGDIVFPRLVSQITKYDASEIHLELCDLIRDFATHLLGVARYREAHRVLVILKGTLFGRAWPQTDLCIFTALQHIALETNLRSDFMAALEAAKQIPARQTMTDVEGDTVHVDQMVGESIKNLKQKMEKSFNWPKGQPNPSSSNVTRFGQGGTSSGVRFLCPTCSTQNTVVETAITDVAGALVICGGCGNVSHVPAAYRTQADVSSLAVHGSIRVPIAEFNDWMLAHPSFRTAEGRLRPDVEFHGNYGLWGICAGCHYQYASTVVATFSSWDTLYRGGRVVFNANSEKSALDADALSKKQCPRCGNPDLLAIMVDVPKYVRDAVNAEKKRRGL